MSHLVAFVFYNMSPIFTFEGNFSSRMMTIFPNICKNYKNVSDVSKLYVIDNWTSRINTNYPRPIEKFVLFSSQKIFRLFIIWMKISGLVHGICQILCLIASINSICAAFSFSCHILDILHSINIIMIYLFLYQLWCWTESKHNLLTHECINFALQNVSQYRGLSEKIQCNHPTHIKIWGSSLLKCYCLFLW